MTPRSLWIAAVLVVALLVAACGSGEEEASPTSTAPTTTTVTPTTTTMAPTTVAPATTMAPTTTTTTTTVPQGDGEVLTATGVVTAVEGNLSGVDSFTIRLEDGSDLTFVPADDALFDGGPFSHIRDHLASGAPVTVEYVELADGTLQALSAGDA